MASTEPIHIHSSSPSLPSPSALLHHATPKSRTKPRASAAPLSTTSGFQSASILHKAQLAAQASPTRQAEDGEKPGKLKRPKKVTVARRSPSPDAEGVERRMDERATVKRRATSSKKEKVVKRAPKKLRKSDSIILNSDEPEASVYFEAPTVGASVEDSVMEQPVQHTAEQPVEPHRAEPPLGHLEQTAVPRRRRSWTPAKDTAAPELTDITGSGVVLADSDTPPARVPLAELVSNFQYAAADDTTPRREENGEATTKRRRISLDDSAVKVIKVKTRPSKRKPKVDASLPKPAKKPKAPKKKAQTITALATAAYRAPEQPDAAQSNVSGFFVLEKAVPHDAQAPTADSAAEVVKPKKPRKSRAKVVAPEDGDTNAKRTTKPRKVKVLSDADKDATSLYSPERACRQIMKQDFLFGSSSQLAVDETPSFIRDMQLAIRQSEIFVGSQMANTSPGKSCARVPTAPHGTNLSVGQAERQFWRSAARDFRGGLHRDNSGLRRLKVLDPAALPRLPNLPDEKDPIHISEPSKESDHVDSAGPERGSIRTSPPAEDDRPRRTIVDLSASSPLPPTSPPTGPAVIGGARKFVTSPSSQRSQKSWQDIDDISDSGAPPTPSPPRKRKSASPPTVRPLRLSTEAPPAPTTALHPSAMLKPSDPQWSEVHKSLFPRITTAIKACTRSSDPEKPSWHQKILLYDPIVVEDLADYLNTQGLRVEVCKLKRKAPPSPKRGRPKKNAVTNVAEEKDGESESVTSEEELQAWMVQKWCEEHSVCCVLRESLWGGSRKRY